MSSSEISFAMGQCNSFQSMGTLDGPGVRYVVFMQGCPLRCSYCHNPDTWSYDGGIAITADEVFKKIKRFKGYFGESGGVTVSGGEPLLQAEFVRELFSLCKMDGIHTALDTSGGLPLSDSILMLLEVTDLVLLDIKMTTDKEYLEQVGCSMKSVLDFLDVLESRKIDTWIRQVIVQGINDTADNIYRLNKIISGKVCIKKVELLPFKKLCIEKYDRLSMEFKLRDYPETKDDTIKMLSSLLLF